LCIWPHHFKSNEDCNVFLAEQDGTRATDQFRAFDDTWVRRVSVIIAVLLWAVGGGSSGTTDAAPKPFSACSRVSLEDATGLWDAAAKLDGMDSDHSLPNGPNVVVCRYKVLAGQRVEKYMTVEAARPVTKAQFEARRQQNEQAFNNVQNIAGLGDQAYSFGFSNFGTVAFRKGQNAVVTQVEYKSDNTSIEAGRIVAGIMPIARRAVGRLP
jgi:hypothetical protein